MKYLKLTDQKYIEYDEVEDTSRVIDIPELTLQVEDAQKRLSAIPQTPTDEELLAWAKKNYPMVDFSAEKRELERIIAEGTAALEAIK